MKKLVAIIAAIMVIVGCVSAFAENKALTPEEAQKIAMDFAGLTADQVILTKCEKDREDGRWVYEIEFRVGRLEYEMDVDMFTGEVTDFDKDFD